MRNSLLAVLVLGIFWSLGAGAQTPVYRVGDTLPDWELRLVNSQGQVVLVKLSALNGKAILLNFYAEWCGSCNAEAPELEAKFWQAYRNVGLAVVGLGVKESEDAVKRFRAKHNLTYFTGPDAGAAFFRSFGQNGIPTNVIIDKDRKVQLVHLGYDEQILLTKVKQLLQVSWNYRPR